MAELTRYEVVIRAVGAPPAPAGITVVDLVLDEDEPASTVIDALEANRLKYRDLLTTSTVFLAPERSSLIRNGLAQYAALYGLVGRLIDVYADDEILRMETPDDLSVHPIARIRQPGLLPWAQVGGATDAMPTVHIHAPRRGLPSPRAAMVIQQASRLRMVPPPEPADAFALLRLVAALRRRGTEDRLPHLSTGKEPPPLAKDDPLQGIDLERIRREAKTHQAPLTDTRLAEVVASRPLSALDGLIAEANAIDIRTVLTRLGCSPDESGRWRCPRPHQTHMRYTREDALVFSGDNRIRCRACDRERIGPVRLVVGARELTPDEAARYILRRNPSQLTGSAVTARVESLRPNGYGCVVDDPVTGERLQAFLRRKDITTRIKYAPALAEHDRIIALVTRHTQESTSGSASLELSARTESLVERLLSGFVPELLNGKVVIQSSARVPGARTKLVVAATKPGVDAKGACLGEAGSRVNYTKAVLERSALIGEESLEIIPYSSQRATLLTQSFKPARVARSKIDSGVAVVAVEEHAAGGAVGARGLNAQLAGKLTGLYVKVVSTEADLDEELLAEKAKRAGKRSRARPPK